MYETNQHNTYLLSGNPIVQINDNCYSVELSIDIDNNKFQDLILNSVGHRCIDDSIPVIEMYIDDHQIAKLTKIKPTQKECEDNSVLAIMTSNYYNQLTSV